VIFVAGVVAGSLTIPAMSAQVRTVKNIRLLTADLGGWCDGKEVVVDLNESSGPGTSGRHYHPAHSFSFMIVGEQTKTVEGMPPKTTRAGEIEHEDPMQMHTSVNTGPVKSLTFRIIEKGKPTTVRVQ
jgi:hypothetical protein